MSDDDELSKPEQKIVQEIIGVVGGMNFHDQFHILCRAIFPVLVEDGSVYSSRDAGLTMLTSVFAQQQAKRETEEFAEYLKDNDMDDLTGLATSDNGRSHFYKEYTSLPEVGAPTRPCIAIAMWSNSDRSRELAENISKIANDIWRCFAVQ